MKIEIKPGQNVYLTSDTHYNHPNICKTASTWTNKSKTRDFKSLSHMNQIIVNNINSMVGEDDILIHFGDVSFSGIESLFEWREQIICKNIYLFFGNHDEKIIANKDNCQNLFVECHHYANVEIIYPQIKKDEKKPRYKFIASHFPIHSWDELGKGRIHLFGHTHLPKHLKVINRAMDVGMDGNNMMPYNLLDVFKILEKQPIGNLIIPQDHHIEN
jgi:calcineurin-like phosphoesterase family protein